MKTKMTLHEVYMKLTELRERRNIYSRLITECLIDENEDSVERYTEKYQRLNEMIDYYSEIEVEFENKYQVED